LRTPAAWGADPQSTSGTRPRRCPPLKTGCRPHSLRPSRPPSSTARCRSRRCGACSGLAKGRHLDGLQAGARRPHRRHDRSLAERFHDSARSRRRSQPTSAPGRGESRVQPGTEAYAIPISARAALDIGEAASPRRLLNIASARTAAPQGFGPRPRRGPLPERVAPVSLGIRCNRHPSLGVRLRRYSHCAKTTDEEAADNDNRGPDRIRHYSLRASCSTRSTTSVHAPPCMRIFRKGTGEVRDASSELGASWPGS
jgi:hypothetical protein